MVRDSEELKTREMVCIRDNPQARLTMNSTVVCEIDPSRGLMVTCYPMPCSPSHSLHSPIAFCRARAEALLDI